VKKQANKLNQQSNLTFFNFLNRDEREILEIDEER